MALTKVTGQVIKNTTDVTVGVLTVTNTLAVGGTVSIGGTLTYEDVTNVDAVGLITARNGIVVGSGITLSKDGDIFATGITTISENLKVGTGVTISPDGDGFFTGVVTATSYYGDGSNLSNITSTTINSNADNRLITGSGTANTLNGETNLTFDGSILNVITTGTDAARFESTAGGSDGVQLSLRATSSSPADDDKLGIIDFSGRDDGNNNTTYAQIRSHSRDVTDGTEDGDLTFHTRNDGTFAERIRIDSSGRLGIQGAATKALLDVRASGGSATMLTAVFGANEGTTAGTLSDNTDKACRIGSYHYDIDEEPFGILVASGTNGTNNLTFGGGTSLMNAATEIKFHTAANSTTTAGTTRMVINSSGHVNIGSASPRKVLDITGPDGRSGASPGNSDTALVIDNDGGNGAIIEMLADNNAYGRIFFTDTDSSNQGGIIYKHADDSLNFQTNGSERVNIDSDGDLTISDGDLIIGTSGHGIDFSATANASGSGASGINETLADYEQGDLTFTVTSSNGGSISYSYRTGHYTRIGNVCHVTGDIRFDGSWSGSNGDMYISLPFTAEATGGCVGGGVVNEWNLTSSSYVGLMIKVDNNESVARVTHHDGSNNNTGSFSTSNLGSSRYLKFAFTYQCQ